MNVLLIWPYNSRIEETGPELFPLGLGYIVANIDRSRYNVKIMDCALNRIQPRSERFAQELRSLQPKVVGISWWSLGTDDVRETIEVTRSVARDAVIVTGGPHATSCGAEILRRGDADFVVRGEAERSFPMLLERIRMSDYSDLSRIPGLVFMNDQNVPVSNEQAYVKSLDDLGRVDYALLDLPGYHAAGYHHEGKAVLTGGMVNAPVMATRGCPYGCEYCCVRNINGVAVRRHSPEYLCDIVRELYAKLNVRLVTFIDDNFAFDEAATVAFCEKIALLRYADLRLSAPYGIRIEHINELIAEKLYAAGFRDIVIAPESGSARTLERMGKKIDLGKVRPGIAMLHRYGLKVHGYFMMGYPGETIKDILLTEAFIFENDFDSIDLHIFQPFPGTPVFEKLLVSGEIDRSFRYGRYNEITYCPQGISKKILREEANKILNKFRNRKGWKYKDASFYVIRNER